MLIYCNKQDFMDSKNYSTVSTRKKIGENNLHLKLSKILLEIQSLILGIITGTITLVLSRGTL